MRGRRIAFDFGDVRIGVAISDSDSILATPLTVLQAQSLNLLSELTAIFTEYEPVSVFIGEPKHMSGESGDSVAKVKTFGRLIEETFGISVIYVDERLSSVSAQKKLKDAGVNSRDSKKIIDAMAAVAILEQGLAIEKLT
ncbi:MAG: Holliday junction resolvase RuvX [Candidatus Planktophila sp.]|nr:Holliday junction resolvase RuvX [Candidatus Planktophila sp.]MSO24485.1 Holliday junction resolvase RuvX [Candidatus Planktophila sp.]